MFILGTPILSPASRSFRFGDSLFETIRFNNGSLELFDFHMERLFTGLRLLGFELSALHTADKWRQEILSLAAKNQLTGPGRVRLTVFRGDGGLYDAVSNQPFYTIECSSLSENYQRLNENGFIIDTLPEHRKGSGALSNLKSGNYLLYILAAQRSRMLKVNECLVLNESNRIADSSIFNLFLVKDGILKTPPLSEAPVAGVMRRHLLQELPFFGYQVQETPISENELLLADEVFLTNALYRIRWVREFRTARYANKIGREIYSKLYQQKA